MSVQDDLAAVKRRLQDLEHTVEELERRVGSERGAPSTPATGRPEGLVTIPDAPYDSGLWVDTDDEGLGARDRHAP
ncbi:hypothetical protein GCM10010222_04570 [Streptomyces tanashiensis]|uniref:hypothetical protein n=1 Tax=Streptomyces tanashiensis TaxID=67367 RepID=UPI001674B94F|nr:hypothetical protein [Streptomyces tanashiensis]GGS67138.1 hypothetical protein GCM10010222_04570 [Streptomyces tanashiensis]